ncbi:hypothetical protein Tco_0233701 [Tanacetum coccineum]
MGTIDSMKSILTQSALDALCEKFHIPDTVSPVLPEMDLFAFIHHADPTKVRIGEREAREGEVPLLQLTRDRVVPLAGVNDQGDQNEVVQDEGVHVVNEESGDAAVADQVGQSDHVVHVRGFDIMGDDEVQAIVADKPKERKKRKAADGAGGSGLPPKKLREDHGTSGIGASTSGKSIDVLQNLLEGSTLHVEVGVTATDTLPFITSFVSLTPEREGGGHTDSVNGPNLRTRHATEMFVVLSDSSHHSSTNAADDEVTSTVMSSVPPPLVLTAVAATTIIIFRDFASTGEANEDVAGLSHPIDRSTLWFFKNSESEMKMSREDDSVHNKEQYTFEDDDAMGNLTHHRLQLRLEHELRGRKKFKGKCAMQADCLKEKDVEISSLKAQLCLKEAEAAEAIRLRGQVATVEAAEAAQANELNVLKERNSALEEEKGALESKVAALESVDATKVAELASMTAQVEKDRLVGQVSSLEGICSGLRDEVMDYKLFKEQIKAAQDDWAKDGLAAGIDNGKAGRVLANVVAYNPSAEADFVSAVNALRDVDFLLLAQVASQKDASIADIMGLLCLEGPAAKAPEAEQLQPSPEQLMLPIHHPEDQVVIRETSLSFSLDVVHSRVQRIRRDAPSQRLSITNAMVPLIEPLSAENLIGEASTSGVPVITTAMSTTFVQTSSVPPISAADPGVFSAEQPTDNLLINSLKYIYIYK